MKEGLNAMLKEGLNASTEPFFTIEAPQTNACLQAKYSDTYLFIQADEQFYLASILSLTTHTPSQRTYK